MKKIICLLSAVLFCTVFVQAQDLITKKNGEDIKAKILEVNQTEVKYKKFDNLDGPVFTISKSEILIIRYENGTNDVFNTVPNNNYDGAYGTQGREDVLAQVVPGMRYRDYKSFYKASDYVRQPGDEYSPAVGGLCSWIVPGLGQVLCGEVGRGVGFFCGAVGASVLMGVGLGVGDLTGAILSLAGSAALLAIDISAIVDGVKVAKVKNMYMQDLRRKSSLDIKLSPYVSTFAMSSGSYYPVAGLSLSLSF